MWLLLIYSISNITFVRRKRNGRQATVFISLGLHNQFPHGLMGWQWGGCRVGPTRSNGAAIHAYLSFIYSHITKCELIVEKFDLTLLKSSIVCVPSCLLPFTSCCYSNF